MALVVVAERVTEGLRLRRTECGNEADYVRVGIAGPTLVGANAGDVVLESARERGAHVREDAVVDAVAREATVGADEDVSIDLSSAGLERLVRTIMFQRAWRCDSRVTLAWVETARAAATAVAKTAAKQSLSCIATRTVRSAI